MAQSQQSLTDQLRQLLVLANQSGLYDAADWLQKHLESVHPQTREKQEEKRQRS